MKKQLFVKALVITICLFALAFGIILSIEYFSGDYLYGSLWTKGRLIAVILTSAVVFVSGAVYLLISFFKNKK